MLSTEIYMRISGSSRTWELSGVQREREQMVCETVAMGGQGLGRGLVGTREISAFTSKSWNLEKSQREDTESPGGTCDKQF